jgi:hypothetical protein
MAVEGHHPVREAEPAGRRGGTRQQCAVSEVHPVELAECHDVHTHGTGHRVGSPEHPEVGGARWSRLKRLPGPALAGA